MLNNDERKFLTSLGYDEQVGSLYWEEGWLARFDDAECIDGKVAARLIIDACHNAARYYRVIRFAEEYIQSSRNPQPGEKLAIFAGFLNAIADVERQTREGVSETSGTYDCGITCTCDAVTDLAAERTELMEEMAAALKKARYALRDVEQRYLGGWGTALTVEAITRIDAVLAKYRGG